MVQKNSNTAVDDSRVNACAGLWLFLMLRWTRARSTLHLARLHTHGTNKCMLLAARVLLPLFPSLLRRDQRLDYLFRSFQRWLFRLVLLFGSSRATCHSSQ